MSVSTTSSTDTGQDASDIALTIIHAMLGTIGILGNGLVLVVMITIRELRTITNLFIINQSVIDMTSSIFLLVVYIAPRASVPSNPILARLMCSLWASDYIFWGTFAASTTNLVMITVERYFAVVHPTVYRKRFNYRRAVAMTAAPWLLGFGYETHWVAVNHYSDGQCIIHYNSNAVKAFIGCLTFAYLYLIPLSVMAFSYISIIKSLRQRVDAGNVQHPVVGNANAESANPDAHSYREKARKNVTKTLMLVSITYAICLTLNQLIYLYFNLGGFIDFDGPLFYFGVNVAFLNMCINPFIYTFKYRKFQKGLKKMLRLPESEVTTSVTLTT